MTIVKVNALIGHQKWEEKYCEVPDELWEAAMNEKKSTQNLFDYIFKYQYGQLEADSILREYIAKKIGFKFDICLERIKIL